MKQQKKLNPKAAPETKVRIWTDGSCWPNPGGKGGWAAVLVHDGTGSRKELSGHILVSTNNRAELTALIEALKALKKPCEVQWTTDSEYVISCLNVKTPKQWKKAANKDLIYQLLDAVEHGGHVVVPQWIRGHTGNPENERCDELAKEAAFGSNVVKVDFAA
jgi:ribonuclease HI